MTNIIMVHARTVVKMQIVIKDNAGAKKDLSAMEKSAKVIEMNCLRVTHLVPISMGLLGV